MTSDQIANSKFNTLIPHKTEFSSRTFLSFLTHTEGVNGGVVLKEAQRAQRDANKDNHPNGTREALHRPQLQSVPMVLGEETGDRQQHAEQRHHCVDSVWKRLHASVKHVAHHN